MAQRATTLNSIDEKYYEVAKPNSVAERVVMRARDRIYADFVRICRPSPEDTILDVGVSDEITDAANVLERYYPYPEQITAAGLGAAPRFQAGYPRVRFVKIEPNRPLPFPDQTFDIATSNAVLEHVGSTVNQRAFLAELLRVSRRIFVTVPHRFFPVEHHTGVPLLHWMDPTFSLACRVLGKEEWARSTNLILMSRRRLAAVCPVKTGVTMRYTGLVAGPLSSNILLFAESALR